MSSPQNLSDFESKFNDLLHKKPSPFGDITNFDFDVFFGLPDKLYKSTNLILVYQFLINNISFDDLNYDNLNKNDADEIKKLNVLAIELQKKALLYTKQQYIINRHTLDILDEIIDNSILNQGKKENFQGNNLENIIDSLMNGVNSTDDIQKGGMDNSILIKFLLIIALLLNAAPAGSFVVNEDDLNINVEEEVPVSESQSLSVIEKTPLQKFSLALEGKKDNTDIDVFRSESKSIMSAIRENPMQTSEPVSAVKALQVYDSKRNATMNSATGWLSSFGGLWPEISGDEKITQIITNFNEKTTSYEQNATQICKKLILEAKQNKIFLNYRLGLNQEELLKAQSDLTYVNRKIMSDYNEKTFNDIGVAFEDFYNTETIQNPLEKTGKFIYTVVPMFNYISSFVSSVPRADVRNEINEQQSTLMKNVGSSVSLKGELKDEFETAAFEIARTRCDNSFNLKFAYNTTSKEVTLIGDRIDYDTFKRILNEMVLNIKNMNSNVENKFTENSQVKMEESAKFKTLLSLSERLEVLSLLLESLNEIVNFATYTELNKILEVNPGPGSITQLENFFKMQLGSLEKSLEQLHQQYPLQFQMLKQNQANIEEEKQLAKIINEQKNSRNKLAKEERYNATLDNVAENLEFIETGANLFGDAGLKIGELSGSNVAKLLGGVFNLATPSFNLIGNKINEAFWFLILTPGGIAIFSVLIIVGTVMINMGLGGWGIKIAMSAGKIVFCFFRAGFYLFYTIISTPIGYVVRFLGGVFRPNNNRAIANGNENGQEEVPQVPVNNANANQVGPLGIVNNGRGGYKLTKNNKKRYIIQKHSKKQKKKKTKTLKKNIKLRKFNKTQKKYKKHIKT